jgi:hypothetical protein
MTKQRDKNLERHYVEFCAQKLNADWTIVDSEAPDFVVTDWGHTFGLEVTRAFVDGGGNAGGSGLRRGEGVAEKRMARILGEAEQRSGAIISATFTTRPGIADAAEIVDRLVALELQDRPLGAHAQFTLKNGLKVVAHRSLHRLWTILSDSAGWVNRQGHVQLQQCVAAKSPETKSYSGPGAADLRLLVVADMKLNSGKLRVDSHATIDLMGFSCVYFAEFPLEVRAFPQG